jgi:hypothetical protein
MPMKIIKARDTGAAYEFCVHLDTAKPNADGTPDEAWCMDLTWGKEPPEGVSASDHMASIQREMKLLAQAELARKQAGAGTKLALEGTAL